MKDLETIYEETIHERNWLLGLATAAALANSSPAQDVQKTDLSDTIRLNRMIGDREKEIKNIKDVIKSIEDMVGSIDKEIESIKKAIARFNNTSDPYQVNLALKYREKIIELNNKKQEVLKKRSQFIEELKKYANVNK
jgi:septal ring factor EnvC (AmiA/AmiB activator)